MSDEGQQLSIQLEARIERYVAQLARAQQQTDRRMRQLEQRSAQTADRMEKSMVGATTKINAALSSLGKGAFASLAGAATIGGLTALVGRLAAVHEGVANIANEARRAGVTTRVFQEWAHVAEQSRIPIDALADGFKELSIRGDEFVRTGKGSGEEAFKRLGFSASDLGRRMKDPSALMLEIITRLRQLDTAAQNRVMDEIFAGEAAERFVVLLDKGADGVRSMIQEAHDLNRIMSDDFIASADEVDRKFKLITGTIETGMKRAIVEATDALARFIDGFNDFQVQQDNTIKSRLQTLIDQRERMAEFVERLEADEASSSYSPFGGADYGTQIADAKAQIVDLTAEIEKLQGILNERVAADNAVKGAGQDAADASPKVETLATAVAGMSNAGTTGASGIQTFADAIRALKDEIPGLTDQLAELDAKTRIEETYQAAINKARDRGSVAQAEYWREQALASLSSKPAREAASKGMLDLIGYAEGTDKGRGYNETLGYGAYTGGNRNLVTMTLDEVDAMQSQMLRHPANGFNSSAAGRYQIVQKTLRGLRGELGLSGSEYFDASMQDRLAEQLLRRRGNDVGGLRNEWEGLRRIDAGTIRSAYDGASVAMPAIDPGLSANREARAEEARSQVEAYGQIIAEAQRFRSEMTMEQQALGMTAQAAAALRYEEDMLAAAKRANIQVSPQQRVEIKAAAASMAEAEAAAKGAAESQEEAQRIAQQWQGIAQGAVKGLVSDLLAGKDAGEAFAGMLSRIADQLIQMAVDQLFANAFAPPEAGTPGAGGGSGGGFLSGIFGAIGSLFGFSSGGYTGDGGTYEPKGVVHGGEFVMSKSATDRLGVANLDALHESALRGFSSGGYVGSPVAARDVPAVGGEKARSASPPINVTSNVTVNAAGGTPEQNQDLARRTAKAAENTIRAIFQQELQRAISPGGILKSSIRS